MPPAQKFWNKLWWTSEYRPRYDERSHPGVKQKIKRAEIFQPEKLGYIFALLFYSSTNNLPRLSWSPALRKVTSAKEWPEKWELCSAVLSVGYAESAIIMEACFFPFSFLLFLLQQSRKWEFKGDRSEDVMSRPENAAESVQYCFNFFFKYYFCCEFELQRVRLCTNKKTDVTHIPALFTSSLIQTGGHRATVVTEPVWPSGKALGW